MFSIIYLFTFVIVCKVCSAQLNTDVNIQCVSLRDCPDIAQLVRTKNRDYTQEILKLSTCGYDNYHQPKVWCPMLKAPNCETPEKKPGKCKPLQDCDAFKKLLEAPDELPVQTKVFIYKHKCEDPNNPRGFSVCCPNSVYEVPVTPKPTPATPKPVVTPITLKPVVAEDTSLLPRPSEGECGQQIIYKLVGGKQTEMDEHAWTTLLEYDDGNEVTLGCGGTLISNRYVVTAAHCVDSSAVRRLGTLRRVILGEYETRNATDCITRQGVEECADPPVKMEVEEIIVHPQWLTKPYGTINHDIALIRLAKPVPFTDYIKAICLPSASLILKDGERLEVVGWGQTETKRESPVKLKTDLPIFNRNECAAKYKAEKRLAIGDGEICAGGEEGKDSCTGDSGGPLTYYVQRQEYSAWFLVGVVSFGPNQPCGIKNYPGIYTYLPKYIKWIQQTIRP